MRLRNFELLDALAARAATQLDALRDEEVDNNNNETSIIRQVTSV